MTNTIKHLKESIVGARIQIEGLMTKVELKPKQNKENFLMISIVDANDELTFPIWDNVEQRYERLNVGDILTVIGTVSEYDGNKQVRVEKLSVRELTDSERSSFVPSYDITEELISDFIKIVHSLNEPYKSIVSECIGMPGEDKWDKFLTAPAAVRHHHNKLGGLFIHTYGVTLNVIDMINKYTITPFFFDASNVINYDRVVSAALLHDVCKREEYTYDTVIGYGNSRFDHRLKFLPYVDRVNEELKTSGREFLSESDLEALQDLVLTHHGPWGGYKPKDIEATIVFLADMVDSQTVGCAEKGDPKTRMTISSMMDAE